MWIPKQLFFRFWYFIWFVALPLGLSWIAVDILARQKAIEEVEVWYVLLIFAALAFVAYAVKERLPFWQDKDPESALNSRLRRKEARRVLHGVQKILKKNGARVTAKGQEELAAAIDELGKALDGDVDDEIQKALEQLERRSERHLAFAQKSPGREYFESIGVAVLVAVVLRIFVIEAFKIPSESMVPTLMVGDHIFVSKYRYGISLPFANRRIVRFAGPKYGEVVVFVKPSLEEQMGIGSAKGPSFDEEYEMAGKDFIKRIVGLPGDMIEMRKDRVFINGKAIPRCRVGTQLYRTRQFQGGWEDKRSELWVEKHGDFTYTITEEADGMEGSFGPVQVREGQVFVLGDNRDNSNDSRFWGTVPLDNIKGRAMFIWWSNRRPRGFQWERVGTVIMNGPKLDTRQQAALAQCPNMR